MDTQTLSLTLSIINTLGIIGGGAFALFQYSKQQKFKRLQNLNDIWHKFSDTTDLLNLFTLCDQIQIEKGNNPDNNNSLSNYSKQNKLKFLALLEEISLYIEQFEVDKEYAKYLFQWHYTYVFTSQFTKELFWNNIGGIQEIEESYWRKSKTIANQFTGRENI